MSHKTIDEDLAIGPLLPEGECCARVGRDVFMAPSFTELRANLCARFGFASGVLASVYFATAGHEMQMEIWTSPRLCN